MKKVFITCCLPDNLENLLGREYEVEIFPEKRPPTKNEIIKYGSDSNAFITTVNDIIDKEIIESCPCLQVIANCAVGYENIDVNYAVKKGIYVTNTPDFLNETTADLAWALILSTARRVTEGDSLVRKGEFRYWGLSLLLGHNVYGKTLGIFGMGRIGSAVARRSVGFSMRVIYSSRNRNKKIDDQIGSVLVDFQTLLRESDYLVITAPINEDTRGRFGMEEFQQMKDTAVLINVGRGPIVRERELANALKKGVIWAAGLDVFEKEPEVDEELIKLNNAVLLPHIGSGSVETREGMAKMAVENVIGALNGKVPTNLVNVDVLRNM